MAPNPRSVVFTDGACSGNPGPGGYAALVRTGASEALLSGGGPLTTNNRMEMLAVIVALEWFKEPSSITVTTDSKYVLDGFTRWLPGWQRRGWRTSAGQPVKNEDLWRRMVQAAARHTLTWQWVRGHTGHPENERVDTEARRHAILQARASQARRP